MYPVRIDISNGVMHSNGGATFSLLVEHHDIVEAAVFKKSHEHSAMDWSIFQELHKMAKCQFTSKVKFISPHELSFEKVEQSFIKNYESVLKESAKSH
ncbi:hypothetical protein DFR28_1204 [Arenicella xantha]|uniref:Uncharacterized protein n=2 Tax=Arenicella xantha TaxID=644221 RepID=A0A395JH65_9GAMM|nr:hypothetical protein DFR28_1204 [Arenicella xantha]